MSHERPNKAEVIPAQDACSISRQLGKSHLPSTRVSNWLWFAPILKKATNLKKKKGQLQMDNHNSRFRRSDTLWILITGPWMCASHPSSLTCHNTAQRTVAPGWRLATAAQHRSSYLTCKLMPKSDWLTLFSKWRCNAFWGCRLNIGWYTN